MDPEQPKALTSDRWEAWESDHDSDRARDWYPLEGDHSTKEEAQAALDERRAKRSRYYFKLVNIQMWSGPVVEPDYSLDDPHADEPGDRDDLAAFSTQHA